MSGWIEQTAARQRPVEGHLATDRPFGLTLGRESLVVGGGVDHGRLIPRPPEHLLHRRAGRDEATVDLLELGEQRVDRVVVRLLDRQRRVVAIGRAEDLTAVLVVMEQGHDHRDLAGAPRVRDLNLSKGLDRPGAERGDREPDGTCELALERTKARLGAGRNRRLVAPRGFGGAGRGGLSRGRR